MFHVEKRKLKKLCLTLCTESLYTELSKGPCETGLELLGMVKMLRDEVWWEDIVPKCGTPGPYLSFIPWTSHQMKSCSLLIPSPHHTPGLATSPLTQEQQGPSAMA